MKGKAIGRQCAFVSRERRCELIYGHIGEHRWHDARKHKWIIIGKPSVEAARRVTR